MSRSTPLYAGEPRGLDADAVWHELLDPADLIDVDPAEHALAPGEPEAERPVDALTELEEAHARARVLVAEQYRAMASILESAEADPDPWVGPDPTLDPHWADPRERSVADVRRERREFAVRAAAADIAVRLRMSEVAVRAKAADAATLRRRCPHTWRRFLGGAIAEQNARIAARAAASLPSRAPAAWSAFDEQVVSSAQVLTPAKFRARARVVRDRVHPASTDERHAEAAAERGVWLNDGDDAMSTLTAFLPAVEARAILDRLDKTARHLHDRPGESRTLAQLRADALCDLTIRGGGHDIEPVVAITVPALTLLGHDDAPATLDG
ncbi:MAG: DUF222 domain-containing protein, partial [Microbacterium sp.]